MRFEISVRRNLNSLVLRLRDMEGHYRDISGNGLDDRVKYGYPGERTP